MTATHRRAIALITALVLLGLTAATATAQGVRPVIFTPDSPGAGEIIEVAFDSNICEGIVDGPNEADIARMGTNIDVIVDGTVADDIILCFFPPSVRQRFILGALPPGRYTVRIVIRSPFPPFPLFPPSASGTVVVAATPIPASSESTLGILATLTLLTGTLLPAARREAGLMIERPHSLRLQHFAARNRSERPTESTNHK